ncbi:WAT1-related protein At5g07050 isoform X3 [Medicago truncatula]|uniref:WAT1-related protein At5g07050 isoform X3 n=1 Tax=Medicago truncatula TaxID=3880 RepID=UPI000D2F2570|nr:WAT1-related protein At5g07050 isoform X3 [Medicago truncatula]
MEKKIFSPLREFKPHLLMLLTQVGYTLIYFITEASFNHGMSPYVYVTYRHIVAGVVMFPFAYFLERFEIVDVRNPRGIAKVLGTLISLAGVMTMTLYKGPLMRNLWEPLIHIQPKSASINKSWIKGSLLTVTFCVTISISYIMQASTLKRYPAQLSLTTWMCFMGAIQSAVFTVIAERNNPSAWIIGFNIDLWSILYGGIVVAGFLTYILLWCTEKKGPVFVTVFNPLCTIFVAILAYFVFGEKLYLGSIIGAFIVIMGLYLLLWGKEGDKVVDFKTKDISQCNSDHP